MHKIKKESNAALFKHAKSYIKIFISKTPSAKGSFIFGAQLKKRTAALWARSAMKGDDCGVFI